MLYETVYVSDSDVRNNLQYNYGSNQSEYFIVISLERRLKLRYKVQLWLVE